MVLLENLFSEPFTQWLSGPHFQKVPQLNEAVISTRMSIQQITCTLGPLILVRWPSGVPPPPQPPLACRPFLVCVSPPGRGLDLSIYTLYLPQTSPWSRQG